MTMHAAVRLFETYGEGIEQVSWKRLRLQIKRQG